MRRAGASPRYEKVVVFKGNLGVLHPHTFLPSRGVLLTGGPGSGKTSLVLSLVESSCFGGEAGGPGGTLGKLAAQLVGYHFCQVSRYLSFKLNSTHARLTTRPPAWCPTLSTPWLLSSPRLHNLHHTIATSRYKMPLTSES